MAPREIKHLFTEKGEVLLAIVMYGAKTLADIQSIFNQSLTVQWTPLNVLLDELIKEGDIFLNESGEYVARAELARARRPSVVSPVSRRRSVCVWGV